MNYRTHHKVIWGAPKNCPAKLLEKPRRNKENMITRLPVDDSGSLESSSMQNGETREPRYLTRYTSFTSSARKKHF